MAARILAPPGFEQAILAETALRVKTSQRPAIPSLPNEPVKFVREILHEDPWQAQEQLLLSVRDHPRTAVRKCHSSGGTRAAAMAVCWWLYAWDDAVVYTLAPTWPQVRDLLWRDIADIYNKAQLGGRFYPASARWEFGPRRYAIGRSTDKPERLQGPHGGHFLLIIDEASGFPEALVQAVEGMLASGETRMLLLSQPTQLSGMFYRAFHTSRASYNTLAIGAYDTPNFGPAGVVRPYLIRPDWVAQRKQDWGEDNPIYQIRVLGQFPRQATDSLIALDWVERAMVGPEALPPQPAIRVLGIDVARYGTDQTAYALLEDGVLTAAWRRSGRSTMATAGEAKALWDADNRLIIVIDDTGVGGGVTDRLREQNVPAQAVNFGERPRWAVDDMASRGSELWWHLAKALEHGELKLALTDRTESDTLAAQLLQPVYTYTSAGKIKVEKLGSKDGPSPDLGDALALAWDGYRGAAYAGAGATIEGGRHTRLNGLFDHIDPYEAPRSIWRGGDDGRLWQ